MQATAAGNCQAFDHKNSKSYRSQWQGSDTESWGGCCAQCGDHCSGWTYVYNGAPGAKGQCWLKTGVGDPSSWDYDPNVISGIPASGPSPSPPSPPSPTPPPSTGCSNDWHTNNNGGVNIPPGDNPVQGVTTWEGCRQACSGNAACVGWTLTYGKCYIKSSVDCMTYDADATSGYCRPWAGPPQCGYHSHAPLQATAVYCDPTLTDPPQLCPGGLACPDCGSNRCACPTGPSPSPTPPAPGNCQAFDHKNSKSYRSQWQGSDTESWGGCCAQCGDGCSGWTYVYNGAHGAKGQCWLKTGVGDPGSWDYDPNVISGLPASGLRGAMVNSSQMQATAAYCNPTLTDPPQLCPVGLACPNCGSNSCACPTGPSPSPTTCAAPGETCYDSVDGKPPLTCCDGYECQQIPGGKRCASGPTPAPTDCDGMYYT